MISQFLEKNMVSLLKKIATTDSQWKSFLRRLQIQERKKRKDFYDEQAWTFLIMSWYPMNIL